MTKPYAAVFIHGLAKKPAPEKLMDIWFWGISRENPRPDVFMPPNKGINLINKGVPHFLNYYADIFYGTDYQTELDSYFERTQEIEVFKTECLDTFDDVILPQPVLAREQAFLYNFEAKLSGSMLFANPEDLQQTTDTGQNIDLEIASLLPLPIKKVIIKKAAMEAFYFLFDKEYQRKDGVRYKVRHELRQRCLSELCKAQSAGEKIVIISHSMGTMIAYDVLRNCPECPQVDTLITLGSPLGIREVQDELVDGIDGVDFPAAKLNRWINIYDPLDPIAGADPRLSTDYKSVKGKRVEDIKESNWGSWRHTLTHYLAGTQFRRALLTAIGVE
jgi:hypothetical protein